MTAVGTEAAIAGSRLGMNAKGRASWSRRNMALLAATGALAGWLRMGAPGDGDPFWGARAGLDTLRSGIPSHDTYSWTARGAGWIPNSWAWNVVLGAAFHLAGLACFPLLTLLLGATLALALAAAARRAGATPMSCAIVLCALGALALQGAPRATVVSTLGPAVVVLPVARALGGGRRPALAAALGVAGIQVAWVNLHSGGLIGPVVVAVYGLGLVSGRSVGSRRRAARRLALLVVLLSSCCLGTPFGARLITHALSVRAASFGVMEEWRHYSLSVLATPEGAITAVTVTLAVVHAARSRNTERLLSLALFAGLTLDAVRFEAPLLLLVMIELAAALARLDVRAPVLWGMAAVLGMALLASAAKAALSFTHFQDQRLSSRLVGEIPHGCRLLNDDIVGGAVILLRPDVPVWFDDRNDMYGRNLAQRALDVLNDEPGAQELMDHLGVTCVLARRTDALVPALEAEREWRVVDTDSVRVLLVRR